MTGRAGSGGVGVSIVIVSKDEPAIGATLDHLSKEIDTFTKEVPSSVEVVVVDASAGRLAAVAAAHPWVRWIDFVPRSNRRVSIADQRNVGVVAASGDVIVFTDSGCIPHDRWLLNLLSPILSEGERMASGQTGALGKLDPHGWGRDDRVNTRYLRECPTINLAFERSLLEDVGGFDESFEYGSDIDFTWRAVHRGVRIRYVRDAVVLHDWGTGRRQLRRAFGSGKARARLYHKHVFGGGSQSIRKRRLGEEDVVPLVYPLYLLGLPLSLRHRWYLTLLLVPLWRGRRHAPVLTLVDHVAQGVGLLAGTVQLFREQRRP